MKRLVKSLEKIRFVLLAAVLMSTMFSLQAQKVAEQDSLALVAFYNATDGPNWLSNQDAFSFDDIKDDFDVYYRENPGTGIKWFEGPVRNWYGVKVRKLANESETDSVWRVVELFPVLGRRENGQNKLKGYLPKELGMLTALEVVKLDGNDGLAGSEIPDEIFVSTLKEFHVEKCGFVGGISDAMKNCTNMRKINLRYNNIYYVPSLDFMKEDNIRAGGIQWFYSTNIAFEYLEPTIDYFYSLSPNIQELGIEARDNTNVGVEREIVAQIGEAVTITINDAGSQGVVSWYKNGLNTFRKGKDYVIASVKESDYADYYGRLENDYVKLYDANPNYGPHDTKPIHLVAQPATPICIDAETSYDGKSITLYFSKPMALPESGESESFSVNTGSGLIDVESFLLTGKNSDRIVLLLTDPIAKDQTVSLDYTPGNVICANGGLLEAISGFSVTNITRSTPQVDKIVTTTSGTGILLSLDKFIDPASVKPSDFVVNDGSDNPVTSISISRGPVTNSISKKILLNLTNSLTSTQTITLSYNRGNFKALYGGMLESFSDLEVTNTVQETRTEVRLTFTDGMQQFDNIFVDGNTTVEPQAMYNDGTHGDETANDDIWTVDLLLSDGDYYWEILQREVISTYDTTTTVDAQTGAITMVITPVTKNIDSLLSDGYNLNFSVADFNVTGRTTFGIADKTVTFNLNMINYSGAITDIYLMGINNDWSEGVPMELVDEKLFSVTIPQFTVGDIIEFSFRNGDEWENISLLGRMHTVKNQDNVINVSFGDFTTSLRKTENVVLSVYPNPCKDYVSINSSEMISRISLHNIQGQTIQLMENVNMKDAQIDLRFLNHGIYLLQVNTKNNDQHIKKIIKN